jgi:6-phosphogluconolactonase
MTTHSASLSLLLFIVVASIMSSAQAQDAAQTSAAARSPRATQPDDTLAYVGTYTNERSKGVYLFRLAKDREPAAQHATLEPLGLAAEAANPSFLEIDPKRRVLFAVSEVRDSGGTRGGAVSAYKIGSDGKLTLINQESTRGAGPCHLALDRTGRFVLAANYGGGSVVVIPVADDGTLSAASDFVQHEGRSVNPNRQEGPHAHHVALDPSNRFALVCDLGLDQVLIYRFDANQGKLTPNDPPFARLRPGAGPRHLAFHPDGRFVYVINELDSTITVFESNADHGALAEIETVSTLPPKFDGQNTTAEIAVHPNGQFLYGSNRGHDSIAVFEIDRNTGKLTYVEHQSTGGRTPRHFELTPRGERLIIANQNTDNMLVCQVAPKTGRLKPADALVECPAPVCVKFLEAAAD